MDDEICNNQYQTKHIRAENLKSKISLLRDNLFPHLNLNIEMLTGFDDVKRLRIGEVRIIYKVID